MASVIHEALVGTIGGQTKRFRKNVLAALDGCKSGCTAGCQDVCVEGECCGRPCECGHCDPELAEWFRENFRLVPDSHIISTVRQESRHDRPDVCTVTCFEVDVSNPLDDSRMRKYADAWFRFDDSDGWELLLYSIDRYGKAHEVNLCAMWYGFMAADVAEERRNGVREE